MKSFAPVVVPTLNRNEHLRRCIESLAKCTYAKDTELIIGLDYPPAEKYEGGWKQICEYLPTVTGFKKVTVLNREKNLGAVANMNALIDYVCQSYDSFIFTEDDNEFSPNFLEFINKGLEKYHDNPRVFSISGYNYPIDMGEYDKNIYGSIHFSAWGCGFWKHKLLTVTKKDLIKFILVPSHFFKILFRLPFKFLILPVMLSRHDIYGDSCYELYCCVNNWVSIFPTVSKVRNWGRDGSGLHGQTDENDPCFNQVIDKTDTFEYDEVELKDLRIKSLDKYFSNIYSSTIKRNIKKLFGKQ